MLVHIDGKARKLFGGQEYLPTFKKHSAQIARKADLMVRIPRHRLEILSITTPRMDAICRISTGPKCLLKEPGNTPKLQHNTTMWALGLDHLTRVYDQVSACSEYFTRKYLTNCCSTIPPAVLGSGHFDTSVRYCKPGQHYAVPVLQSRMVLGARWHLDKAMQRCRPTLTLLRTGPRLHGGWRIIFSVGAQQRWAPRSRSDTVLASLWTEFPALSQVQPVVFSPGQPSW